MAAGTTGVAQGGTGKLGFGRCCALSWAVCPFRSVGSPCHRAPLPFSCRSLRSGKYIRLDFTHEVTDSIR